MIFAVVIGMATGGGYLQAAVAGLLVEHRSDRHPADGCARHGQRPKLRTQSETRDRGKSRRSAESTVQQIFERLSAADNDNGEAGGCP